MKKEKKLLIFSILVMSSLILVTCSYEIQAEDTTLVWIGSDPHIGSPFYAPGNGTTNLNIVINDAISHNPDYAFCLGDNIHGEGSVAENNIEWGGFWSCMDNFTDIENDLNRTMIIGNHDISWGVNNNNRSTPLYYTVEVGNVLFIAVSDLLTSPTGPGGDGDGWYNYGGVNELAWIKTTVQANPDKNIIILAHYPPYGSTAASSKTHFYVQPSSECINMLNWFDDNGYPIAAWFHGHTHCGGCVPLDNTVTEVYGTTVVCGGNAGPGRCESTPQGELYLIGRTAYLYFEEGSKSLLIKQFDSYTSDWCTCGEFPHTIQLNYAFTIDGVDEEIQFISIDGGGNCTIIYDSTPTFNWTIVDNTIQYWLQIATDSGFNSIVVDIDDINEANYPIEYDENATRVSFTLPDADSLSGYVGYYCRVCAKRF